MHRKKKKFEIAFLRHTYFLTCTFMCLLFLLVFVAFSESCFSFQSLFFALLCTLWTLFYGLNWLLRHTFHNMSHIHFANYFVGEVIRFDANVKSFHMVFYWFYEENLIVYWFSCKLNFRSQIFLLMCLWVFYLDSKPWELIKRNSYWFELQSWKIWAWQMIK